MNLGWPFGWRLTRDRFVLAGWAPPGMESIVRAAAEAERQAEIDNRQEEQMAISIDQIEAGRNNAASELEAWWLKVAEKQIERTIPKVLEYGSDDLRDLGAWMADQMGLENPSDGVLVQLGIAMYLRGKLSRITTAIKDGREPSIDSWFDLGVYSVMGLRAREVGAWPGVDLDELEDALELREELAALLPDEKNRQ